MRLSLAFVCVFAFACGSDDSLGEGNGRLQVSGTVEASNQFDNASSSNDFTTSFEVTVRRDGVRVDDAVVIIDSDGGPVELTLDGDGDYTGTQVGYAEVYRLDVDAGEDFVHDVQVDGPDIHTFDTPTSGAQVDAALDLIVEWSRDDAAEIIRIEAREMDELSIEDTGSYTLPIDALNWSDTETNDERIRLVRANRVSPEGAAGDSSFTVEVRNEVEFLAVP